MVGKQVSPFVHSLPMNERKFETYDSQMSEALHARFLSFARKNTKFCEVASKNTQSDTHIFFSLRSR